MATLDELIASQPNPFDGDVSGDFYQQPVGENEVIDAIHENGLAKLHEDLARVVQQKRPYTTRLVGFAGAGKTFMLGRFQREAGNKARFVYIGPWSDNDRIWRHVLRCTVRSWQYPPPAQTRSQILRWYDVLKAQCAKVMPQADFARQCTRQFPHAEQVQSFCKAVAGLEHEETHPLSINWLRGDDLSEEDLAQLGLKSSIDNEEMAKAVLTNLLRISPDGRPTVLCFDQLNNLSKMADGEPDFTALFDFNTQLHNDYTDAPCLIVISLITETYFKAFKPHMQNRVDSRDRIRGFVETKPIPVEQIKALWRHRLAPLHAQADPSPAEPLMPLHEIDLESKSPTGKHLVRTALRMGYHFYQAYKEKLPEPCKDQAGKNVDPVPQQEKTQVEIFHTIWREHYAKIEHTTRQFTEEADVDLVWYLAQALMALGEVEVKRPCLDPSRTKLARRREALLVKEASLCFSWQGKTMALVWTENDNMTQYCWFLRVVEQILQKNRFDRCYLIRAGRVGNPNTQGRQLYDQLTQAKTIEHLRPTLPDLKALKTLHALINKVAEQGITLQQHPIDEEKLYRLARESQVLDHVGLLAKLRDKMPPPPPTDKVEEAILEHMEKHNIVGMVTLEEQIRAIYTGLDQAGFDTRLEKLVKAGRLRWVNPNAQRAEQLICWVPETSPFKVVYNQL